jgi:hypothetical protein
MPQSTVYRALGLMITLLLVAREELDFSESRICDWVLSIGEGLARKKVADKDTHFAVGCGTDPSHH